MEYIVLKSDSYIAAEDELGRSINFGTQFSENNLKIEIGDVLDNFKIIKKVNNYIIDVMKYVESEVSETEYQIKTVVKEISKILNENSVNDHVVEKINEKTKELLENLDDLNYLDVDSLGDTELFIRNDKG